MEARIIGFIRCERVLQDPWALIVFTHAYELNMLEICEQMLAHFGF